MRRALTISVALATLLGATAFFHGGPEPRTYTAVFSRAVQLFPGGNVRVVGVDVGEITDVRLADGGVEVDFRVDDPDVRLPADVGAAIIPQSLLGERYVQLLPAYQGGPELQDGATIPAERTAVPSEPDELLRSLQDYFGALDPEVVGGLIENAARILDGNGQELNQLIGEASTLIQTLAAKRGDLAAIVVQFERLSTALATRQRGLRDLIHSYNTVAHTLTGNRVALEGTIVNLSDAAEQLASLLATHRQPLKTDIRRLTKTSRTISKNIDRLTKTGHWANRLFRAASRAVDYHEDWLRLNNQGQELAGLILMRLQERLMDWCSEILGADALCAASPFWAREVPSLFCFRERCPEPPKGTSSAEEELTQAIEQIPDLADELLEQARDLTCADASDVTECLERRRALIECADAGNPQRCLRRRSVKITCAGAQDVAACIERARRGDLQELVEGLLEGTIGEGGPLGGLP